MTDDQATPPHDEQIAPPTDQPSPDQPSPDQPSPDQPSPDQPSPDQPPTSLPSPTDQPSPPADIPTPALVALLVAVIAGLLLTLALLLGWGPFGAPAATPEPTPGPSPTAAVQLPPTPEPTRPPTPRPASPLPATAPPTPSPTPTEPPTPVDRLVGHIPEALRDGCVNLPGVEPVLAFSTCTSEDGQLVVVYSLYAELEPMHAVYAGFVTLSEIERDTGHCTQPRTWPTEGSYTVGDNGGPVGRLLCMATLEVPSITWTHDELAILAVATSLDLDYDRLWRFWQTESGPY